MAAFVGMDPAAIRRLATQLGNSAGQLEAVAVAVQQVIDDAVSQWEGVDGQDFVAAWSGQHRLQLNESAGAVRLLAETASLNADAQDETSSAASVLAGLAGLGAAAVAANPATAPLPAGPPASGSPTQNADWWNSLTPAQQAAVLAQHPEWVNNLDGIPGAVRDEANRALLPVYRDQLQQQLDAALARGDDDAAEILQNKIDGLDKIEDVLALSDDGGPQRQLLVLDITGEKQLKAAVAIGDVDTADNIAVFTPGLTTTVEDSLAGYDTDMLELYNKMGQHSDSNATVSYLGYEAPQLDASVLDPGLLDGSSGSVASDDLAQAGADDLAGFYNGLDAMRGDDANVTALGHSYGSLTTSLALQQGTGVDNAIFFGSPGLGLDSLSDLGLGDGHAYYTEAGDDYVGDFGAFDGDPSDIDGITHLSSEESPFGAESRGHSDYLDNDSTSQHNMAVIATGRPDLVVGSDGTDHGVPGAIYEDLQEQADRAGEWIGDRKDDAGDWLSDRKDDIGGLFGR